ncbi:MAG: hypothetical protein R3F02_20325 [Thiolinea sp.]
MNSAQKKSLELMRKHLNSISDAEFLSNHRKTKNFGGITVDEFLTNSRYAGVHVAKSYALGSTVYKRPVQRPHTFDVSGLQPIEVRTYFEMETHGRIPANDPSYCMAA